MIEDGTLQHYCAVVLSRLHRHVHLMKSQVTGLRLRGPRSKAESRRKHERKPTERRRGHRCRAVVLILELIHVSQLQASQRRQRPLKVRTLVLKAPVTSQEVRAEIHFVLPVRYDRLYHFIFDRHI